MIKPTEEEKAKVVEEIKKLAEENNFGLTDNVERIANAKLRFFGMDNWKNCPCVNDGEHACISPKCKEQIEKEGVCHCNLFKKEKRTMTKKQEERLDKHVEEDFDMDDFLMKEKLSRFSQKERLKQIKDFKPSLIIHNDEFKGECYDLEEYQKEFSLIEDLFAIRFYYINKKRNAVGFQIFIEDDGNFYLWNSDNGGVHTDWIPKLYLLIKKADKMINDYSHGHIKPNRSNS